MFTVVLFCKKKLGFFIHHPQASLIDSFISFLDFLGSIPQTSRVDHSYLLLFIFTVFSYTYIQASSSPPVFQKYVTPVSPNFRALILILQKFELLSYTSEAYYTPLTANLKVQLARSVARYGLFGFLNSNRIESDLLPLVESFLPTDLKKTTATLINQHPTSSGNLRWKKRVFQRLIGLLTPLTAPVLKTVADVSHLPGTVLHASLTASDSDAIITDSSWGSTTVKTQSFGGDLAWSTMVSVGTPSQNFRLNIDSGSADLFLFSPNCSTCSVSNHTTYVASDSTTAFVCPEDEEFMQTFGDGSTVEGGLAVDVVTIGNSIKALNQTFGLAEIVSSDWADLPVDGLMGIGPDSLSILPVSDPKGVFSNLVDSKTLFKPVIGIALTKETSGSNGEFTFGDVSDKWIRGGQDKISWKNVTSNSFWGVSLTGIFMNGTNVMSPDDPPRAILDTGTSLTIVSEATAASIHAKIPGAVVDPSNGVWSLPCSIHHENNPESIPPTQLLYNSVAIGSSSLNPKKPGKILGRTSPFHLLNRADSESQGYGSNGYQSSTRPATQTDTSSPNVFFEFGAGSLQFAIPAEDLAYMGVESDSTTAVDGMCYSGIQAGSDDFAVLGDTFIKNQYLALRYDPNGQKSVGLGQRADLPICT